jgi:hypothetical protein
VIDREQVVEADESLARGDETLLDDVPTSLTSEDVLYAAEDDGGPTPLAELAKLLPGGEYTRGKPEIVYTPTLLDTRLLPDLVARPPTLVVLSGNAGDGKTAFISEALKQSGESYVPGQNVYPQLLLGGVQPYIVVLDGSEDTDRKTNDELLEDALGHFRGPAEVTSPPRGTLIAINKGRLLKFLDAHKPDCGPGGGYPFLWDAVRSAFLGGRPIDSGYLLIDLNERTVVGPGRGSLLDGVLDKLLGWSGWAECERCEAYQSCPALFNVRLLRDGDEAMVSARRDRVWSLFAAADLDDRLHVTARHVTSELAQLITAGLRCPDVRATVRDSRPFRASTYLYNSAFVGHQDGAALDNTAMGRSLGTFDPSEKDVPFRDQVIHEHVARADVEPVSAPVAGHREPYLSVQTEDLARSSMESEPAPGAPEYRLRVLSLTHNLARRMFFAEPASRWAPRFALDTMDDFVSFLRDGSIDTAPMLKSLIHNLNAALGIERGKLGELLAPRDYGRGLRGKGFALLLPPAQLALAQGTALGTRFERRKYLETWPRTILLQAADDGRVVATLSIPLLLFEVLNRAGRGFRPTTQAERGYMVRLQGFYRALAEHKWSGNNAYALYDNGRVIGRANLDPSHLWLTEI